MRITLDTAPRALNLTDVVDGTLVNLYCERTRALRIGQVVAFRGGRYVIKTTGGEVLMHPDGRPDHDGGWMVLADAKV